MKQLRPGIYRRWCLRWIAGLALAVAVVVVLLLAGCGDARVRRTPAPPRAPAPAPVPAPRPAPAPEPGVHPDGPPDPAPHPRPPFPPPSPVPDSTDFQRLIARMDSFVLVPSHLDLLVGDSAVLVPVLYIDGLTYAATAAGLVPAILGPPLCATGPSIAAEYAGAPDVEVVACE